MLRWLVRSAILILYPRAAGLPGAADVALDAHLERFERESPALIWLGTVAGAVVFHLTPLFTVYVPLPAFWLPAKLADTHASRITQTEVYLVRQAVFLVKLCAGLGWAADPAVRAKFALPPLGEDPVSWRADS